MRRLLNKIKKTLPSKIWVLFRRFYYSLIRIKDDLGPYIRVYNYCGIKVFYNKGNGLIKRLKDLTVFEKEMCESIVAKLYNNEKPVFIDIGSNIGLISTYVVSKVGNVYIYAFEPGESQRSLFEKTVFKNSLNNIKIFKEAVGDKEGIVNFYTHNHKDVALDGLRDTGRRDGVKVLEVQMITLDKWWLSEGKPKVSVIKIDTEGAELLALKGAENMIREIKPIIFLEIEPSNLRAYEYDKTDILSFFEKINYSLKEITRDTYMATTNQQ